jgi:hypothetical protein
MLNGKERNGTGRSKWNDQNTHTERFTSERNRTRGRDGGREGKFFSIITCTNGTERNVMESQKRTERSDREGEIEKEMK